MHYIKNKGSKTQNFLILLLRFSITCATFISGVYVVERACKGVLLPISSQVHGQGHHAGRLRSA